MSGYAALASVGVTTGNSNADHPALTPSIYAPSLPLGQRISNTGMPTTDIPRVYHSSVTLTPQGFFLIAGSNPNPNTTAPGPGVTFPTEFRVEHLNTPSLAPGVERPTFGEGSMPSKLAFGKSMTVNVTVPEGLDTSDVKRKHGFNFCRRSYRSPFLFFYLWIRGVSGTDGPRVLDSCVPFKRTSRLHERHAFGR